MANMSSYSHSSSNGPFWVLKKPNGQWHAYWDQEHLGGPYGTAEDAVLELSLGHTQWPSCGNPATFGLSEFLSDWTVHGPK